MSRSERSSESLSHLIGSVWFRTPTSIYRTPWVFFYFLYMYVEQQFWEHWSLSKITQQVPRSDNEKRLISEKTTDDNRNEDVCLFFLYLSLKKTISALCLFDRISVTEIGPFLARHQIVIHPTGEVFLGDVAAHRVLIAILDQAAHVLDHTALATALMIERKTAALRWRRREQLLRERVRGHTTPWSLPWRASHIQSSGWKHPGEKKTGQSTTPCHSSDGNARTAILLACSARAHSNTAYVTRAVGR